MPVGTQPRGTAAARPGAPAARAPRGGSNDNEMRRTDLQSPPPPPSQEEVNNASVAATAGTSQRSPSVPSGVDLDTPVKGAWPATPSVDEAGVPVDDDDDDDAAAITLHTCKIDPETDAFLDKCWGLLKRWWDETARDDVKVLEYADVDAVRRAVRLSLDGRGWSVDDAGRATSPLPPAHAREGGGVKETGAPCGGDAAAWGARAGPGSSDDPGSPDSTASTAGSSATGRDREGVGGGASLDEIYSILEATLAHSMRTSSPRYMNNLYGAVDIIGILGEVFVAFANTGIYTYDVSPVFTLMEAEVIRRMCLEIGWPPSTGDGIFAPGGSMANIYSMLLARQRAFPNARDDGLFGLPPLVAFVSQDAHYSLQKAGMLCGMGFKNVVRVGVNEVGQMRADALRGAIADARAAGKHPFLVVATAGTTVKGAFDDLHAAADVAEAEGCWFHVDAAWGGSAMFAPRRREALLSGITRADSVTWDAHKGMGVPLQCALFLVKSRTALAEANALHAEYLFKTRALEGMLTKDKEHGEATAAPAPRTSDTGTSATTADVLHELRDASFDLADKAFQCGRRCDSLKVWLMFKRYGTAFFRDRVENGYRCRDYFLERIAEKPKAFKLVAPPMYLNVCFWYIPESCRDLPPGSDAWITGVHHATQAIRRRMLEEGRVVISYQPQGTRPNFFRPIFCGQATTTADVDVLIDAVERHGRGL